MIEWLFTFLVLYLLYKLIFNFIIPISRVSSQVRSKMNQMHQQPADQKPFAQEKHTSQNVRPAKEDYIDFEEIK